MKLKHNYARLEKFSLGLFFFTVSCAVAALIASATMVIPVLISSPLLLIKWLLSTFTEHSGAISDAILVWYLIFIYFWAVFMPFWTSKVIYLFGIFNLIIALAYGAKGERNGIDNNIFFFIDDTSNLSWMILGGMCLIYLILLYAVAKIGNKKYLKKMNDAKIAEEIEVAKYKKCPHCAETILAEAKACKHCGRDI